jgi:hypothetical protein
MTRDQLEHLIRAAAVIADDDTIVIVGSQSVLGQFPDAPSPMRISVEADLYPLHYPERADLIEGSIGELSPFHKTFGYYAQGVSEETAILPEGWKERLLVVSNENTRGAKGLCLEIHDLLVSKLIAGREKDLAYFKVAAEYRMADPQELLRRLDTVEIHPAIREKARAAIEAAFRKT